MNFHFFGKLQSDQQSNVNDDQSQIKEEIIRELLRQVHHSYNLALGVTATSSIITLLGVGLLYLEKIPEASITAGGGILASLHSVEFAKGTKEELSKMMKSDDD